MSILSLKKALSKLMLIIFGLSLFANHLPLQGYKDVYAVDTDGTIRVTVSGAAGNYAIWRSGERIGTPVAQGGGIGSHDHLVLSDLYDVVFSPVADFTTPPDINEVQVNVGSTAILATATYTAIPPQPQTGTVTVNVYLEESNGNRRNINDGDWELFSCSNVTDLSTCTTSVTNASGGGTSVQNIGIYGIRARVPANSPYSSVVIRSVNPQPLPSANSSITFDVQYAPNIVDVALPSPAITVSNPTPAPGETVVYTVNYANLGNTPSMTTTLGFDYDETTTTIDSARLAVGCQNTMMAGNQVVECQLGALAMGARESLDFYVNVNNGVVNNTLIRSDAIIGDPLDSNTANNMASLSVRVTTGTTPPQTPADPAVPNIRVVDVNGAPLQAGDRIQYFVQYTNLGQATATAVSLGTTYDVAQLTNVMMPTNPLGCTLAAGSITCAIGDLPGSSGGTVQEIGFYADVLGTLTTGTRIQTSATISTTGPNSSTSNDRYISDVQLSSLAQTSADPTLVSKTATSTNVTPARGETIRYSIIYGNNGQMAATNAQIIDDYDERYVGIVAGTVSTGCTDSGTQLTCTLGNVAGSSNGQVNYFANILNSVPASTIIRNTATITALSDSNATNNTQTANVLTAGGVSTPADPEIQSKTFTPAPPAPIHTGDIVTYTITYRNNGSSDATNAVIIDDYDEDKLDNLTLPANCQDTRTLMLNRVIRCNLGTLAAGGTGSIMYTGQVAFTAADQDILNTATIQADTNASTGNDTQSATFRVANTGDIQILMRDSLGNRVNEDWKIREGSARGVIRFRGNGDDTVPDAPAGVSYFLVADYGTFQTAPTITPASSILTGAGITFNVLYTPNARTGTVQINMNNDFATPIQVDESWTLRTAAGATVRTGTGTSTEANIPAGNYILEVQNTMGFAGVTINGASGTTSAQQAVQENQTATFDVVYQRVPNTGAVEIVMTDDSAPATQVSRAWGLYRGNDATNSNNRFRIGVGSYRYVHNVPVAPAYFLDLAPVSLPYSGVNLTPANPQAVTDGALTTYNVVYRLLAFASDPAIVSKRANVTTPNHGEEVIYTISYINNGVSASTNTRIIDDYDQTALLIRPLPAGCTDDGNRITCDLGTLASNATGTIAYRALVNYGIPRGTAIQNQVTITADTNSNTTNDSATATVTVSSTALPQGTVNIRVLPSVLARTATGATYNIVDQRNPNRVVASGRGDQPFNLEVGPYSVIPQAVSGYPTPNAQNFMLTSGANPPVYIFYLQSNEGILNINTNEQSATYTITNDASGDPVTGTGNTRTATQDPFILKEGTYTLTAANVPGRLPLAPIPDIRIIAGQTTLQNVFFSSPGASGTIDIIVTDDTGAEITNGEWSLTGPTPLTGTSSERRITANIGTYTLTATLPAGGLYRSVTPAQTQTLTAAGTPVIFNVMYTRTAAPTQGTLVATSNLAGARYEIHQGTATGTLIATRSISTLPVNPGPFTDRFELDPGTYVVVPLPVTGFNTPANQNATIMLGQTVTLPAFTYTLINPTTQGGLNVTSDNVPGSRYTITNNSGAGTSVAGTVPGSHALDAGTYTLTPNNNIPGYRPLAPITNIQITAGAIENRTLTFTALGANEGLLQVINDATTAIPYTITHGTDTPVSGTGANFYVLNVGTNYVLTPGDILGYRPLAPVTGIEIRSLNTTIITLSPVALGPNEGKLRVITNPTNATYAISGNGIVPRPGVGPDIFVLNAGSYTVTPNDVPNYTKPPDQRPTVIAGVTVDANLAYTPIASGTTGSLTVIPSLASATYTVTNSANQNVGQGTGQQVFGNLTPGDYRVTGNAFPGFTTPTVQTGTVVTGQNVDVRLNYAGPELVITKTATRNNPTGSLYTYKIMVTNNSTQTNLTIRITDTVSGATNVINGNNGGKLTYLNNGGACSISCDQSQISNATGILATLNPGVTTEITYSMDADTSGIPTNGSSTIINTATATATIGGTARTATAQASVTLSGPAGGIIGPSGGGGGLPPSGGPGGHQLIRGNIGIEVSKMVSVNGGNFVNARSLSQPVVLPKNRTNSAVTYKVTLKNTGSVSIIDAIFKHEFKADSTGLSIDEITNVEGAAYNRTKKEFTIEKILSGGSIEFTYSYNVSKQSNRQAGLLEWFTPSSYAQEEDRAVDALILNSYRTRLTINEDALTYNNIGDIIATYFFVGELPAIARNGRGEGETGSGRGNENGLNGNRVSEIASDSLRISVVSNTGEARPRDEVRFMITLENLTENNLTNLILTHDFDDRVMEILKAAGSANNGRELSWKRAILAPQERVSYEFSARIRRDAPSGVSRGITRLMLNEFDFSDQIENVVSILGGGATLATPARITRLAPTGPIGIAFYLMLLALIANLGYRKIQEKRYVYIKKMALSGI